jgi:hypothetical protein
MCVANGQWPLSSVNCVLLALGYDDG